MSNVFTPMSVSNLRVSLVTGGSQCRKLCPSSQWTCQLSCVMHVQIAMSLFPQLDTCRLLSRHRSTREQLCWQAAVSLLLCLPLWLPDEAGPSPLQSQTLPFMPILPRYYRHPRVLLASVSYNDSAAAADVLAVHTVVPATPAVLLNSTPIPYAVLSETAITAIKLYEDS